MSIGLHKVTASPQMIAYETYRQVYTTSTCLQGAWYSHCIKFVYLNNKVANVQGAWVEKKFNDIVSKYIVGKISVQSL